MSKNSEAQYRIQELHRPHQLHGIQGECGVTIYDDTTPLGQGAARGRVQGDKAVLARITGTGCRDNDSCENPGLSTRIATATGSAVTAGEALAWFALCHNRVREDIRGPEAQGIRDLGEAVVGIVLTQMESGCDDLETARNETARAFLIGEAPLPSSAVAEVMASEPDFGTTATPQQAAAL